MGAMRSRPGPRKRPPRPEGRRFLWLNAVTLKAGSCCRGLLDAMPFSKRLSNGPRAVKQYGWSRRVAARQKASEQPARFESARPIRARYSNIFVACSGADQYVYPIQPRRPPKETTPACVLSPRGCPTRILSGASRRRALRAAACTASRAEEAAAIPTTGNCLQRPAHKLRHNQNLDHGDVPRLQLR
jgi:hypothetical protein